MTTTRDGNGRRRRRFITSKIIFALLVCFFLTGVAGRIWWGYVAQARLDEAFERIRARGEPTRWAELAPEPVPDDQNAALLYRKLDDVPFMQVRPFGPSSSELSAVATQADAAQSGPERERNEQLRRFLVEIAGNRSAVCANADDVADVLKRGREALLLCRQARPLNRCVWGIECASAPTYDDSADASIPYACLRRAAKLLSVAALQAHEDGRDDEALEYVLDMLAMGDSLDTNPVMLSHLVAIATDALATYALEEMAYDLRIGDQAGQVSPEALQAAIAELLDSTARREGLARAFIGESCWFQETLGAIMRGELDIGGRPIDWLP